MAAARRPLKPTCSSATRGGALSFRLSVCGCGSWTKSIWCSRASELLIAGHQQHGAVSAMHDLPAEIAGDAFLQAVGMVAADHDQLGSEFLGLLEDELCQPVWSVAIDVGGSLDPCFDQLPGHGFAESERLGNRLPLEGRSGRDDPLPHVDHEHL